MHRRRFWCRGRGRDSRLGLDCRDRLGGHDCRSSIQRIYRMIYEVKKVKLDNVMRVNMELNWN